MKAKRRHGILSNYQLFSLVVNLMVATGVFTIARAVAEKAGRGVVLSIPLAGVLALLQLSGMYLLSKRFPGLTLPEYAPQLLGRFVAPVYLAGYFLMNLGITVLVPRNFWPVVDAWDFHTSSRVLIVLFLLVSWNMARRGVVVLARVSEILLTVTIPVLVLLLLPHSRMDLDQLRPLFDKGPLDLIRGVLPAYFSMVGFDVLLFVFPFTQRQSALKVSSLAVGLVTFFYTGVSILIITTLSLERTLILTWPLQTYLNNFAFAIVDRLDVLFLMTWSWEVIMSMSIPMFMAGACLRGIFPALGTRRAADICLLLAFAAAVFPVELTAQNTILNIYSHVAVFYVGTLPFLLWLLAVVRKKGGNKREQEDSQVA